MIDKFFIFTFIFSCLILNADVREVKLGALPTLSPSGDMIVFNWNGDIWKVAATGGR